MGGTLKRPWSTAMTDGPQASRRRTRGAVLVYAIVFALIATGVAVVVIRLVTPPDRVEDERAGLAYELPSDWEELASYDRWDRYSSGASGGLLGPAAFAFAQPVAETQDIGRLAELLVEDHALMLRPELVDVALLRSEPIRVGEYAAHEVELTATDPAHGPVYARMLVVDTGAGSVRILFGFANESHGQDRDDLAVVFASVETI